MATISESIQILNQQNKKALSVFLTVGYPNKKDFVNLALDILNAGADMLELGIPFSDPLADGPVIQQSSQVALENGMDLKEVLKIAGEIRSKTEKPLILMGYANPILRFGLKNFLKQVDQLGINGLIVPDIPLEEYHDFWGKSTDKTDKILLTTPNASAERVAQIDVLSSGFVYYVSVKGTTGVRTATDPKLLENLKQTRKQVTKNKLLVGFGISTPENIKQMQAYCDGFIVGSAVIKSLQSESAPFKKTLSLVAELAKACHVIK